MSHAAGKRNPERKRVKLTGKGRGHTYLQLRHDLMRSPQFRDLSGNAVKLLLFLAAQFNGRNNGNFSMAWSMLMAAGWRSETTATKARDELLGWQFIVVTRHGNRRLCSLYAVTWLPIDECVGKGLEKPSERLASDAWKTARFDPQKLGY